MTQFNLGKLFLIPSAIDQNNKNEILLDWQAKKIRHIKQFIVENEKAARSILKEIKLHNPIQTLKLFKNSSSTTIDEIEEMLSSIFCGEDMGLLSDSGVPCVADPGSKIVEYAHKNNIKVIIYANNHFAIASRLNTKPFFEHLIKDKIVMIK